MCGIAGIFYFRSHLEASEDAILSMCQTMTYRGPDDSGVYIDCMVGLGHRRLSIIDTLSRSRQPMTNMEEDAVIVFNGEIYNYLELRKDLESEGFRFKTQSDTEVILQMYRKHGERCLQYFNGIRLNRRCL